MDNIEKSDSILIVDDEYIDKIRAEYEEKIRKLSEIKEKQEKEEQLKKEIKSPPGMVNFVRGQIQSGEEFTMRDIYEACDIPYENRTGVNKVYSMMLNWRNAAKRIFNDPETIEILEGYETEEDKWDAFLDILNANNIFLLYRDRNGENRFSYYQPSWTEKEALDYLRMNSQFRGQITVLTEMTIYGEDFDGDSGILISPESLKLEMENVLAKAKVRVEVLVDNKIKELTAPEE